ncbi:hypothetical protein NY2A_b065R [Paramecium bursaria Chlorella virus NY2A]|uniref:Uncharacterized protein b065R n=1 Tax=Paramecium bursaria Chlorella virus NY2A TaxID=46021 RepID=A7IVU0_PBCVN|nr:hypothetical protein NY2A_b065R [Paramecium bursaria Chlorella virus NY2A]ABT14464.1 hypothetical protein NY2A_b065R [Paramecium bursaria Chlorella virus NY2A]
MVNHISFTSLCFSYGILMSGRTRKRTRWFFIKKTIASTSAPKISDSEHGKLMEKMRMITGSMTERRPQDNHVSHMMEI